MGNQAPAGASEGRGDVFAQVAVQGADGAVQHRAGPEADPSERGWKGEGKMKIYVTRTSGSYFAGEVREYSDLKECVDTLLDTEKYGKFEPGLVIYRARESFGANAAGCEYEVEIYDDWRE